MLIREQHLIQGITVAQTGPPGASRASHPSRVFLPFLAIPFSGSSLSPWPLITGALEDSILGPLVSSISVHRTPDNGTKSQGLNTLCILMTPRCDLHPGPRQFVLRTAVSGIPFKCQSDPSAQFKTLQCHREVSGLAGPTRPCMTCPLSLMSFIALLSHRPLALGVCNFCSRYRSVFSRGTCFLTSFGFVGHPLLLSDTT